ncbi:unnamed protein product [Adineta steineri]|uniref:UBC core domain-containing protein n=1 Tax=Adineta steineri TaxID=433720 RepID=A0A820M420_9BILA|nr:unnamed protein product [Adineta steineri]
MAPSSSNNERVKFIYVNSTFDDIDEDDSSSQAGEIIIKGRLLPNSELYKNNSLPVDIILDAKYPMGHPKVKLSAALYHPNVDKEGNICINLLTSRGWNSNTGIRDVIIAVTDIIDNPSQHDCAFAG